MNKELLRIKISELIKVSLSSCVDGGSLISNIMNNRVEAIHSLGKQINELLDE